MHKPGGIIHHSETFQMTRNDTYDQKYLVGRITAIFITQGALTLIEKKLETPISFMGEFTDISFGMLYDRNH